MEGKVIKIEPVLTFGDEHKSWESKQGGVYYDFRLTLEDGEAVIASAKSTTWVACKIDEEITYEIKTPANEAKGYLAKIGGIKRKDAPAYNGGGGGYRGNGGGRKDYNSQKSPGEQKRISRQVALEVVNECRLILGMEFIGKDDKGNDSLILGMKQAGEEFTNWLIAQDNGMMASKALREAIRTVTNNDKAKKEIASIIQIAGIWLQWFSV